MARPPHDHAHGVQPARLDQHAQAPDRARLFRRAPEAYAVLKGEAKADMADKDDYVEIVGSGKSFLSPEEAGCKMPA